MKVLENILHLGEQP